MASGRPRIEFPVPGAIAELEPTAQDIAMKPHHLNFTVNEFDYLRMSELAYMRGQSVSDLVRTILTRTLDEAPEAATLALEAIHTIRFMADKQARQQTQ